MIWYKITRKDRTMNPIENIIIIIKQSYSYLKMVLYLDRNMANYSNMIILKDIDKRPLYICFMYKHYRQGAPWSSLCDVCVYKSFYMIWLITPFLCSVSPWTYYCSSLGILYCLLLLLLQLFLYHKFYAYSIFWLPWRLSG